MDLRTTLNVLYQMQAFQRRERWSRARLAEYQAIAVQRLRTYAYSHSPFYASFHRGLTDRPLQELPVLTKAMVMEHFDDLVTDRAIHLDDIKAHITRPVQDEPYLGRYWVIATSGSTGHHGLFLFEQSEWIVAMVGSIRAQGYAGWKASLRKQKYATITSDAPFHMSSLINNTSASPTTPVLRLAATDGIDKIVPQLNAWQPEMLVAYASLARLLAEEQLHGRLNIHPRSVVTNGEVLTHEARQRIKVAWGTEPFNQYGATEAGQIAAECEQHRGMHLFEDLALVEVVDERNRPVPPGTYGEKVLVTVFFNHVQPLIRYELTDSIKLATESCPCGRSLALIEDIQGRVEQVLHLPGCNGGQVAVHPLTFHKVMDTVPVHGWQVVYNTSGLTILLCGASSEVVDATLIEKVSRELLAQGVSVPTVETRRVLLIPRTSAGKSPLVKSMVTE